MPAVIICIVLVIVVLHFGRKILDFGFDKLMKGIEWIFKQLFKGIEILFKSIVNMISGIFMKGKK